MCINLAYVAAEGILAAEQARQHSLRRSIAALDERMTIGSLCFRNRATSLDRSEFLAELERAVATLTTNDTESKKKNWPPIAVRQRIETILEKCGLSTAGILFFCNRSG